MAGVINGKDIADGTISLVKFVEDLQQRLTPIAKVVGGDLSSGKEIERTFDGITVTANNDGTNLSVQITSSTEYENVLVERTIFSGSGSGSSAQVATLGSTPIEFTSLLSGANPKVQYTLTIPSTQSIYDLTAVGNAGASSTAWNNVSAWVIKR